MKSQRYFFTFLAFVLFVTACGSVSPIESGGGPIESQADLIVALRAAGAGVDSGDSVSQPFFTPEGQFLTINGAEDIQVFEYENSEAMEFEASQVAPNGDSVGTSMINWVGSPHFYKIGRLIVLYLGDNQEILNLLNRVIGPQFAGR